VVSSVPAQRVLGGDWRRNESGPARVVHVAPPASLAVTRVATNATVPAMTLTMTLSSEISAEKSTAHERGASRLTLTHLRVLGDGAAALVSLLSALVPAGNDEHGRAVGSGNTGGSESDSSSGSLLRRGLFGGRATAAKCIIGVVGRVRGCLAAGGGAITVQSGTVKNVDGWVNEAGHLADQLVGVHVKRRVRVLVVRSEFLDHLVGHVSNSQSRDVSKLGCRIIGPERVHDDLILGHAKREAKGLGDKVEHLSRRDRLLDNEGVVQGVLVCQLNQSRVLRCVARLSARGNRLR
jgi:hypothetical protein